MKKIYKLNRFCIVELVSYLKPDITGDIILGTCYTENHQTTIKLKYNTPDAMWTVFNHEMSHFTEQQLESGSWSETVADRVQKVYEHARKKIPFMKEVFGYDQKKCIRKKI